MGHLPAWCPAGWRAKWSERRQQPYFFRVNSSGGAYERNKSGKPKCYWIHQLRDALALEGFEVPPVPRGGQKAPRNKGGEVSPEQPLEASPQTCLEVGNQVRAVQVGLGLDVL